MRPVLFELGSLQVRSYGVVVALAFVAAWVLLRKELERRSGRGDAAAPLVSAAGVGGLVGARLYWFAEHAGDHQAPDLFSGAGFTWYGGVLGGALAVLGVVRITRVELSDLLGAGALALPLGYGLGRIACQLAGDGTYGAPSDLPWAMSYPNGEVPTTQRVHPTPVYETLASLAIFGLLWRFRRRAGPIQLFALYLLLAGLERFLVEFIRINDPVVAGLTQPQLFAIGFMAAGALLAAWSRRTEAYTRGPDDSVPRRQLNLGDAARLAGGDD
ncbi:MAG: prolipoprotein diacylglyceryl transferase [Actinomycetota bacterium]|nr:prolipoprotein diacylglyceryl transferase [Actinomycetota bacterium]